MLACLLFFLASPTINPPSEEDLAQARALYAAGDYQAAVTLFDRVVAQTPDLTEAWLGRALTHLKAGDTTPARRDFEHTLRLAEQDHQKKPALARPQYHQAVAHHYLGHVDKALKAIKRAMYLDPNSEAYQAFYQQLKAL